MECDGIDWIPLNEDRGPLGCDTVWFGMWPLIYILKVEGTDPFATLVRIYQIARLCNLGDHNINFYRRQISSGFSWLKLGSLGRLL
jgi:hypothetical protein